MCYFQIKRYLDEKKTLDILKLLTLRRSHIGIVTEVRNYKRSCVLFSNKKISGCNKDASDRFSAFPKYSENQLFP